MVFRSDILTSGAKAGYQKAGEMSTADHRRALTRVLIVLVVVADRTAGPAATDFAYLSVLGIALALLGINDAKAGGGRSDGRTSGGEGREPTRLIGLVNLVSHVRLERNTIRLPPGLGWLACCLMATSLNAPR